MKLYMAGQLVNGVLGELTLSKSKNEAAAILSAVILTGAADRFLPEFTLALGDGVILSQEEETVFCGGVQEIKRGPWEVEVIAYDRGIYLTRNELYGVFAGSGSEIVTQVAQKLGIALGSVEACTGYQTILTTSGDTAYDVLRQAVGEDKEIYMEGERLCVGGRTDAPVALAADHILQVQSVGTIRSMINRAVVLKRGTTTPLATAQNAGEISAYGQFQATRTLSGSSAQEQAAAALSGVSYQAEVTVLGDLTLRCGGSVVIEQKQWGLDGTFSITGVDHHWSDGLFTTTLSLQRLG